jgi:hypothetical protein
MAVACGSHLGRFTREAPSCGGTLSTAKTTLLLANDSLCNKKGLHSTARLDDSLDQPLTWNNSQRLVGDPVEAVARLKVSDGPDLLIQGSSMLYQALLPAGLVDQLTLITFPVMLGRGKRWYSGNPTTARSWTLVEQAHSPKGVHFASFARDGEVRTGSFATKPPSEDELALRRRQAEGRW